MAEPTLVNIFGSNATQDVNNVHLSKTNLQTYGLTKQDEQSPEGVFAAIFLQAATELNTVKQAENPDIDITITRDFQTLVERNGRSYREYSYSVKFQKLDLESDLSPDDF